MRSFLTLLLLAFPYLIHASSSLLLQNNTPLDLTVSVSQTGSQILTEGVDWFNLQSASRAWEKRLPILETTRDQGLTPGETVFFQVNVSDGTDIISLKLRVQALADSSILSYSAEAPGWNFPWFSDNNMHSVDFNAFGKPITLSFKPINTDQELEKDLLFVVHDRTPDFAVIQSDLGDPNILNVLSYNIKIFPDVLPNAPISLERAAEVANHIDTSLDVVVFQEVFWDENIPGSTYINALNSLETGMNAIGFINTEILNPGPFGGADLKTNGGVIIFSRWPILKEDDFQFPECDNNSGDCFARKGVKYAHINKLGTPYHIFGTHAEAGSNANEIGIKKRQYKQMRDFVEAQNISSSEAVVFAGDFNANYINNSNNLYQSIRDSLRIIPPTRTGWPDSSPGDAVDGFSEGHTSYFNNSVIDYVFAVEDYRLPYSENNHLFIFRSIDSTMWPIFDFGDHIPVHGRLVFPGYTAQPMSQTVCIGDSIVLEAPNNLLNNHQWFKDGVLIPSATSDRYVIYNATAANAATYTCNTSYNYTHETNVSSTLTTEEAIVTVINTSFTPTITQAGNTLISDAFSGNQWYNQNGLINGATEATYSPSILGDYYVIVTLNNCSTSSSNSIGFVFTNTEDLYSDNELVIFPNPTTGDCWLDFSDRTTFVELMVYNSTGQQVIPRRKVYSEEVIQLGHYPGSIFFLQIWDGIAWQFAKIIVTK